MASEFAHPGLFGWLDVRPREQWPTLLRDDVAWGTEKTMFQAEERGFPFYSNCDKPKVCCGIWRSYRNGEIGISPVADGGA